MGRAIQKLLYPIRDLTAGFPHHEVEIQLEVDGSLQRPLNSAWRRLSHAPAHKSIVRSENAPQSDQKPSLKDAEPKNPAKILTDAPTIKNKTATENNSENVPLYRNEFQKAISLLEKKILDSLTSVTSTTSGTTRPTTTCPPPCGHHTTQVGLDRAQDGQREINRILELLKRGMQVKYHLNQPMDPNLEWVQVKIPK